MLRTYAQWGRNERRTAAGAVRYGAQRYARVARMHMFRDREEAGKLLAKSLVFLKGNENVVVLAIPRGGVLVAYEVTRSIGAPLDVIITRKIGAPGNPELAIGAVAQDGRIMVDRPTVEMLGISEEYIRTEAEEQHEEIRRRSREYRGERPYPDIRGKTVVIVDDGVATGATVRAAIQSVRTKEPAEVILAVPVGPRETISELSIVADRVVCLISPEPFYAVGEFYQRFDQVEDSTVTGLLRDGPTEET